MYGLYVYLASWDMRKSLATVLSYSWLALIVAGLYVSYRYDFLLFHSLIELATVCMAFAMFVVVWNSRQHLRNNYLLFLAIAFLYIGGLDFIHLLAYEGRGVF